MDWIIPLRSQQNDFISRMELEQLLKCPIIGFHSEERKFLGEKLAQIKQNCEDTLSQYKKSNYNQLFSKYLQEKLGQEFIQDNLGDLVTIVEDIEKSRDLILTNQTEIGIKTKVIYEQTEDTKWLLRKEELENNAVLVCFLLKEKITEAQSEYNLILAGFLPTSMIYITEGKTAFTIDELLYGGGLRSYLESLITEEEPDYTDLGDHSFIKKEYEEAIELLNKAIEIDPSDAKTYLKRGRSRYYLGDLEGAIADYTESLKHNYKDASVYYNRGIVKSEIGDIEGAIKDYSLAIKINPNDPYAYYNRGKLRAEIGDIEGAIKDYSLAIKINPNDPYAYYNRGKLRAEIGDKEGAIQDYNQAININPKQAQKASKRLKNFHFNIITVNSRGLKSKTRRYEAQFFTEKLTDKVVLEMVSIPEGYFYMGVADQEKEKHSREMPQHQVQVKSFFMAKYPITQSQWRIIAALPQVNCPLNLEPSSFQGDNLPVETITWYEAVEFCQRLSQQTGRNYRLPTEAEWEFACRGKTATPFYFGETINTDLVNYDGKYIYGHGSKGEYRGTTTLVGSFPPNLFGLYDMHGNVWEWCADHWHLNYKNAPTDGSVWLSDNPTVDRVRRGGSWYNNPASCRSAYRHCSEPGSSYSYLGLRVVCES